MSWFGSGCCLAMLRCDDRRRWHWLVCSGESPLGSGHGWMCWSDLCPRALCSPRLLSARQTRPCAAGGLVLAARSWRRACVFGVADLFSWARCYVLGRALLAFSAADSREGLGLSLSIELRATRRRLWAVLLRDGEHAPLAVIMGSCCVGEGHHMHSVICSLALLHCGGCVVPGLGLPFFAGRPG